MARIRILTEEKFSLFKEVDSWLDVPLPTPPFYECWNEIGVITWVKSPATEMLSKLELLVALLKKYGVALDVADTYDLGRIVYDDECQAGTI